MAPSAGSWLSWWRLRRRSTATSGCGTAETVTPSRPICRGGHIRGVPPASFDVLANPADTPRDLREWVDSSPMAASTSCDEGQMAHLQRGIDALAELQEQGVVGLGLATAPSQASNCKTTASQGPHPAGNVGVQIHHTSPINKGEVLWTWACKTSSTSAPFEHRQVHRPSRGGSVRFGDGKPRHLETVVGAVVRRPRRRSTTAPASSAAAC